MATKHYSLSLPIFKQGDDFASALEENNKNPVKGFLSLADRYIATAEICKTVAKTLLRANKFSSIDVGGDTHSIWITAPEKLVQSLVEKRILTEDDFCKE